MEGLTIITKYLIWWNYCNCIFTLAYTSWYLHFYIQKISFTILILNFVFKTLKSYYWFDTFYTRNSQFEVFFIKKLRNSHFNSNYIIKKNKNVMFVEVIAVLVIITSGCSHVALNCVHLKDLTHRCFKMSPLLRKPDTALISSLT